MDPDGVIAGGCQATTCLRAGFLLKGDLGSALPYVWLPHISSKFWESVLNCLRWSRRCTVPTQVVYQSFEICVKGQSNSGISNIIKFRLLYQVSNLQFKAQSFNYIRALFSNEKMKGYYKMTLPCKKGRKGKYVLNSKEMGIQNLIICIWWDLTNAYTCLYPLQHLELSMFLILVIQMSRQWCFFEGFMCISLKNNDDENLFMVYCY